MGLLVLCACTSVKPVQNKSTINFQADIINMNNKQLIIDRFEGDYAVCEDENLYIININKALIPTDAPEGAVLIINNGIIEYDEQETISKKDSSSELLHSLYEK